jgi:soluble lytic murein transglycosylase-like protein
MRFVLMRKPVLTSSRKRTIIRYSTSKVHRRFNLPSYFYKQMALLTLTALMALGSIIFSYNQQTAFAAGPGYRCAWYIVHRGDKLSVIARSNNTTTWQLASVNHIRNVNLIFIGQRLCIPYGVGGVQARQASGILANGTVRWYAYNALDWSTRGQVVSMLRLVAAGYRLPANLLLAIAWQESGWYQHVIAWDGGIGVMQLMPYTAMGINAGTGMRRDPYRLWDNINLGATYLSWLWRDFHGYLVKVISAYNEGGWAVIHRGIFNWRYVRNVLYLMRRFG